MLRTFWAFRDFGPEGDANGESAERTCLSHKRVSAKWQVRMFMYKLEASRRPELEPRGLSRQTAPSHMRWGPSLPESRRGLVRPPHDVGQSSVTASARRHFSAGTSDLSLSCWCGTGFDIPSPVQPNHTTALQPRVAFLSR